MRQVTASERIEIPARYQSNTGRSIIRNNQFQYMEVSEARFLELILTHDEAYVAQVSAALQDVKAGRIQRGTADNLIKALSLED